MSASKKYIVGRTLDIGAGERNRYGDLFDTREYVTMDIEPGQNVSMVGSIEDIPAEVESFDSIVCTQVLEHVPHPARAAREMYRVLRSGGYAVVTVPQMNELHEEPYDFFRYTCFGAEAVFVEAGFVRVEKLQRGGFFALRAQTLIRYVIDRLALYNRPIAGRIAGTLLGIYGRVMLYLDTLDTSVANRKHAIGWCYVFQKSRQ